LLGRASHSLAKPAGQCRISRPCQKRKSGNNDILQQNQTVSALFNEAKPLRRTWFCIFTTLFYKKNKFNPQAFSTWPIAAKVYRHVPTTAD
jgi:hypothetical protein